MYLVVIFTVFALIISSIFYNKKTEKKDSTPPLSDDESGKSIFETLFGDIFEQDKTVKKEKEDISTQKSNFEIKKEILEQQHKEETETKKYNEEKEKNHFDLKQAVIYSEIINNPYIDNYEDKNMKF